jgi:single-strand DNA-binding protein
MTTPITLLGNLTSAIELRWTQSGKAVGNVTVAVNRKRGEVEETDFHRVTLWESLAENAATLEKGTRVIVVGRLTSREYETREGEKRVGWDVTADAFGPDLRWAQASVTRAASNRGVDRPQEPATGTNDTWVTPGAADDETPF